jgi:uncharacterized protein (DUF305 family)
VRPFARPNVDRPQDQENPVKRLLGTTTLARVSALALTGCGSDHNTTHNGGTSTSSTSDNEADEMFLAGMVRHHSQALTMSHLAKDRAASPQVRSLAAKIEAAQGPEIATMEGWLRAWGVGTSATSGGMEGVGHGSGGPGMGHGMPGMMSDADMALLKAATGLAFDELWLKMMTEHHRGAVDASRTEQAEGTSTEVKALARRIETVQAAEIAQMEKLLSS